MGKKIIFFTLITLIISYLNCSLLFLEEQNCFQLVKYPDGKLFSLVINSGQWWSSTTLSVKINNVCNTPQEMKELAIIVKNWKVNSVLISNGVDFKQTGDPWLTIAGTYPNDFIQVLLSTPDCEGEGCDWAKIPSGRLHEISLVYGISGVIQSSIPGTVSLGGPGPKGKLEITVANFPSEFTKPVEAIVINVKTKVATKAVISNTIRTITVEEPEGNVFQIKIPGIGLPGKGVYYLPLSETSRPIIAEQTIKLTLMYSENSSLYSLKFISTGYLGTGQAKANFLNSQNYIYNDEVFLPSGSPVFKFPSGEVVSVIIECPEWNVTTQPTTVSSSVTEVHVTFEKAVPGQANIGGYYQSWSSNWASLGSNNSLAHIPSWVSHVLIAFANPNLTYKAGSNSFQGTGLSFSSDFKVIKDAISIAHSNNKNQKFFLSVGGATYPWSDPNFQGMIDLMNDLGLDGLDIDLEDTPSCSQVNSDSLNCSTDGKITNIINTLRSKMPADKLLTAAVFSVGAYGTSAFPNSKYPPVSNYDGMWVNPLKNAGGKLDAIFIMTYDASPVFSPTNAFNAYKTLYGGHIFIGLEVPPEAWGGYELTVEDALRYAKHSQASGGYGVFIWSFEKQSGVRNANYFLQPICSLYNFDNCDQKIPLN